MDILTIAVWLLLTFTLLMGLSYLPKRGKNLPPGPTPWPIIGSLHLLGEQPHQSLAKLAKKHGPIMSLKLGQITTIVVSSVEIAKEVLKTQDVVFCSRQVPNSLHAHDEYKYSVIWMPVAARWKNLRRILSTNVFNARRLDDQNQLRSKKVQELIDYCRKCSETGETVNIGRAAFTASLNSLSNTIFSKDVTDPFSDSAKEFKQSVNGVTMDIGTPNLADFFPILAKIDPQGIRRRMAIHLGNLLKIIRELIDERLTSDISQGTVGDILDILLTTSHETPELIDRKHIEHMILDLFIAGTDSTTGTVEWAMAEMVKNSDEMKKVQDELAQVIGKGNVIKESDIARLPYLQCVIKETLRLHTPGAFLIPRQALQQTELCGYNVPKGSQMLVNTWAISRDETLWKDALKFMPERFLESKIDMYGHDFEFLPFGAGRRMCPGLPLAFRMVHVILGSLLNCFNWKLEGGNAPEDLNMEERYGLTLPMAHQLHVVPIPL